MILLFALLRLLWKIEMFMCPELPLRRVDRIYISYVLPQSRNPCISWLDCEIWACFLGQPVVSSSHGNRWNLFEERAVPGGYNHKDSR